MKPASSILLRTPMLKIALTNSFAIRAYRQCRREAKELALEIARLFQIILDIMSVNLGKLPFPGK